MRIRPLLVLLCLIAAPATAQTPDRLLQVNAGTTLGADPTFLGRFFTKDGSGLDAFEQGMREKGANVLVRTVHPDGRTEYLAFRISDARRAELAAQEQERAARQQQATSQAASQAAAARPKSGRDYTQGPIREMAAPRQFATWGEALDSLTPRDAQVLPQLPRLPLRTNAIGFASPCKYPLPDSVALVADAETSIDARLIVAYSTREGVVEGVRILPPMNPDTLRATVVSGGCRVLPEGYVSALALEADGRHLLYGITTGEPPLAWLRGIEPGGALTRLEYDKAARRHATPAALGRLQRERQAADAAAKAAEQRRQAAAKEARRKAQASKIAEYRKRGWSERAINAVLEGKIYIGMTAAMVRASWGEPEDINRTTYPFGVHEQWVYSGNYVYLEDGKVTTIQN